MAAFIEYLCMADHERNDESAITLVEGLWAYCRHGGGADGHEWQRIRPTDYAELRMLGPYAINDLIAGSTQEQKTQRR